MKKLLQFVIILFMPLALFAQDQVFTYDKNNAVQWVSNSATIVLGHAVKTKAGVVEKLVTVNNHPYTFTQKKTENGKIMEVSVLNGAVEASILMDGKDRYSIVFPDGARLTYKKIDKQHWVYEKEGRQVVSALYQKVEGKKQIILHHVDSSVSITHIIQMACMERGSAIINSSAQTGRMIGIAFGLALVRVALASGNSTY